MTTTDHTTELARLRADHARLTAILALTSGRPGYHTISVKQILTAGAPDECEACGKPCEPSIPFCDDCAATA